MSRLDQPHLFEPPPRTTLTLNDRFLVPPFSVLDARAGYWQDRKREWMSLGIRSELGRGEGREQATLRREGFRSSRAASSDGLTFGGGMEEDTYYRAERERALQILMDVHGCTIEEAQKRYVRQEERRSDRRGGHLMRDSYAASNVTGAAPLPEWANNGTAQIAPGTSIFDPVLCELVYRWFAPESGLVLDPFAGGSVRGIVAAHLGRQYLGVDLRPEQVESNITQAETIGARHSWPHTPAWLIGDSADVLPTLPAESADLIFTCPPYYDLEQYSDDPRDLSNAADYGAFLVAYRSILADSVRVLRPDRFALVVVGEIRLRDGTYAGLVPDTIAAMQDAGARYYNEGILLTQVGTLALRVSRSFGAGRKIGKTHQNVLGFVKGDPRKAAAACPMPDEVAIEYGGASWSLDPDGARVELGDEAEVLG